MAHVQRVASWPLALPRAKFNVHAQLRLQMRLKASRILRRLQQSRTLWLVLYEAIDASQCWWLAEHSAP
jgi:hypothetical protein